MIWELRHEHKIGLLIDVAGIPRSTYYYYSKQFNDPKPDKYAAIKEDIRRIYDESKGRYGYRRITKELRKTHMINHKTVQRLMRKMGIFCRVRVKKYNSFRGEVGRIAVWYQAVSVADHRSFQRRGCVLQPELPP